MTAAPALRRWGPGALWLGAWPLAGGLSQALLRGEAIPVCGFQALTGCPCPLCGGTHLVQALTRWDWAGAWQAQPGLLPLLLGAWLVLGWRTAAGRRGHQTWAPWERRLLWAAVVFWLGEWAWRVGASLSGASAVSG
jgi:hypothetical protein